MGNASTRIGFIFLVLLLAAAACPLRAATLTVCAAPWEPHIDPSEQDNGWLWKVTREAFALQGYDSELRLMVWARAMLEVEQASCDALASAYYSPDRSRWGEYSEPVFFARTVLLKRKDNPITFNRLEDLEPYSIGVQAGAYANEAFERAGFLHKVKLPAPVQGIQMVYLRRLDLQAYDERPLWHLVDQLEVQYPGIGEALEVLPRPLSENSIHLVVSKKHPQHRRLIRAFNEGIRQLKRSGRFDRIQVEYGIAPDRHRAQ